MQQFCIINLKHMITTTYMAIKPDKNEKRKTCNKETKQKKKLHQKFTSSNLWSRETKD